MKEDWRLFSSKDGSTNIFERMCVICNECICNGQCSADSFRDLIRFAACNQFNARTTTSQEATTSLVLEMSNLLFKTCLAYDLAGAAVLAVKHSKSALPSGNDGVKEVSHTLLQSQAHRRTDRLSAHHAWRTFQWCLTSNRHASVPEEPTESFSHHSFRPQSQIPAQVH